MIQKPPAEQAIEGAEQRGVPAFQIYGMRLPIGIAAVQFLNILGARVDAYHATSNIDERLAEITGTAADLKDSLAGERPDVEMMKKIAQPGFPSSLIVGVVEDRHAINMLSIALRDQGLHPRMASSRIPMDGNRHLVLFSHLSITTAYKFG